MESLLSILLKSSEIRMIDMIDEFEDFSATFDYEFPEISEFMRKVFRNSEMSS